MEEPVVRVRRREPRVTDSSTPPCLVPYRRPEAPALPDRRGVSDTLEDKAEAEKVYIVADLFVYLRERELMQPPVVVVREQDPFARSNVETCRTCRPCVVEVDLFNDCTVASGNVSRVVTACVADYDQFVILVDLCADRVECFADAVSSIVCG